MAQFQTTMTNGLAKPWDNICCEACWTASQERCVCRCGGEFHGVGNPKGEKKKNQKLYYKHQTSSFYFLIAAK